MRPLLAFLSVLVTAAATVSGAAAPAYADLVLEGDVRMEGMLEGTCQATGVAFPALTQELGLSVQRATLEIVSTRRNDSSVAGAYVMDARPSQSSERHELAPGPVEVDVNAAGVAAAYAGDGPAGSGEFTVAFAATRLSGTSFKPSHPSPAGPYYPSATMLDVAQFRGWSRAVLLEGTARVNGSWTLLLKDVVVRAGDQELETGPWRSVEQTVGAAGTRYETTVYRHALLRVEGGAQDLPSGSSAFCGASSTLVNGTLTVAHATGQAGNASRSLPIDGRLVELAGVFRVDERPPQGPEAAPSARIEGDFAAMGIDFVPVSPPRGLPPAVAAGAGILLALAAAWALVQYAGSMVGFFYSRFGRDKALDNPNRDLVYQAVLANPGSDLSDLGRLTPFHITTIAYHVQVLERVGLVGTMRHGRSVRVLPKDLMHKDGIRQVVASRDERLAYLADLVRSGTTEVRALVDQLTGRFAITPRAAYMMIDRAVERGLLIRSGTGRGGMVQCAQ